ncbi:MAG: phosphomevalonate kinase [Weissella confusa]|nr:phosphomevalonate kinase [Weissella confusa]
MTTAKAPGKLYLAGEYAVTLSGQPSVVIAVDRFVTADVTRRTDDQLVVVSDQLGEQNWPVSELPTLPLTDDWRLVIRTLQVLNDYLLDNGQPVTGLTVSIKSHLNADNGQKLGLGSSAAVVVALIKAVIDDYELPMTPEQRFKLAALITLTTPNFKAGSMGDIAAASLGGVILYSKFDTEVITEWIDSNSYFSEIIARDWPLLRLERLGFPADWQLLVGWTGAPADTQQLLAQGATTVDKQHAKQLLAQNTAPLVNMLVEGLRRMDYDKVATALRLNQEQLFTYTSQVGLSYMTPQLLTLLSTASELGASAKISGAGGGDNGIAITNNPLVAKALTQAWLAAGIQPLPLSIATL